MQRTLDEALSVRALEALVREAPAEPEEGSGAPAAGVGQTKLPALLELEELLGERFATKVGITLGAKRGKMTIDFADVDDLERIYGLIVGE